MKSLFRIILILASASVLWMGGKFFFALYHFLSLSRSTPAQITHWESKKVGSSEYLVSAECIYRVKEKNYTAQHLFSSPKFPNEYAAKRAIEHLTTLKWEIWYCPQHPEIASLQKLFPFKKAVHLLLSFAVLCYFIWFRGYTQSLSQNI